MHKYQRFNIGSMSNTMIDDIKKLLDGDFGDDRILKDIYRACKNNEVISNYERKYVRDLTKHYLYPNNTENSQDVSKQAQTDVTPDVILPEKLTATKKNTRRQQTRVHDSLATKSQHADSSNNNNNNSVRLLSSTANKTSASKGKIVAITIGVVVLVLILAIAAVVIMMMMPESTGNIPVGSIGDPPLDTSPIVPEEFHVRTDLDSYAMGDIISISGWFDIAGESIDLSIVNPANVVIWTESTLVKSDGTYSTLTIAGGNSGWNQLGIFIIHANANGDDDNNSAVEAEFEIITLDL